MNTGHKHNWRKRDVLHQRKYSASFKVCIYFFIFTQKKLTFVRSREELSWELLAWVVEMRTTEQAVRDRHTAACHGFCCSVQDRDQGVRTRLASPTAHGMNHAMFLRSFSKHLIYVESSLPGHFLSYSLRMENNSNFKQMKFVYSLGADSPPPSSTVINKIQISAFKCFYPCIFLVLQGHIAMI